ncbi:uncharacterized protein LOC110451409 [Mizuhopecten yessoensis]|uniref:uncharacterized protein LOC110451409 n=1 Tax=Mizuhopecten yessoensis TaxID=6573 RepID=UPI000B45773A|nr:uncharacterized protein LOC110451409 [Mizuhopecten yessoensis]
MCAAKNMFVVSSQHVTGKCNMIADSLSRLQMDRFRRLAPEADHIPEATPVGSHVELGGVIDDLWEKAIAPSTRLAYSTGFNFFIQFLLMAGLVTCVDYNNMSVSEDMLIHFVAHCYNINLSYATIKLYLCAVKFMCLKENIPYPSNTNLNRIQTVLGGVKRARVKNVKPRYPITFNILKDACAYIREKLSSFSDLMFETACTVAFFGCLRCGEFTVNNSYFDHNINLCVSDMVISEDCVLLHLKKSKTDPFRDGVTLKLFNTDTIVCPNSICSKYMKARQRQCPSPNDPLFVTDNGQALSKTVFIAKFRHVLQCLSIHSDLYNGHSFRIGAATSSAAAIIEDHLIKVLGRWSSDAYCRYIRTPQSSIRNAQRALTMS